MEALFLIFIIAGAFIGLHAYKNKKFRETSYYQVTKNAYSSLRHDKGRHGEYLIYESLRHLERTGGKFLFNIYIPKSNGEATEIDVVLICPQGLIVFESKNYSGWIFGNEAHESWTQTLPKGKGRSHKERFYNPIRQNASHIKHLRRIIGDDVPIASVIAFSDRCTLKDVTIKSKNVSVVNRSRVESVVAGICSQASASLISEIKINEIYSRLYPLTQVDNETRARHDASMQKYKPR